MKGRRAHLMKVIDQGEKQERQDLYDDEEVTYT